MAPRSRASLVGVALILVLACGDLVPYAAAQDRRQPLPECEWCGAREAPSNLGSSTVIAGADEPGERLVVTGTVFASDGETPAPGVLLYLYHTNAGGVYPKRGDETGNGRRHGYLRGWLRTGEDGRYRVSTIKPGSYPTRAEPAHIHITVTEPGGPEYWIDSIHFADDPLLTPARRAELPNRGGSGVVTLKRSPDGTLTAVRDIVLEN